MKRIAILCEVMHAPFDEGIRIFAAELARSLSKTHETLLLAQRDSELDGAPIHGVLTDRWFLSRRLARLLRGFDPDLLLYVPWTSLTSRSLVRIMLLRRRARRARLVVMALQPRTIDPFMSGLVRLGAPDLVAAAGPAVQEQAARLGLRTVRIHPGVDLERFRPATPEQRADLKRRAGIDPDRFVVLHVGHVKASRNVGILARLAGLAGVHCMLVASTSTERQGALAAGLESAGVIVMTRHHDRIEFAYRLADAYLFPATSVLDAIEVPLSVLEAAACDLEIVSTRFGGLPDLFPRGIHWVGSDDEMVETIGRLAAAAGRAAPAGTRGLVESFTWDRAAAGILEALVEPGGGT